MEYYLVITTAPNREEARRIAREIVDKRVAACVNIVERVESIYIWQDEVQEESEALMLIKSCGGALEELKRVVIELHPYEVPEFIAIRIDGGSEAYLGWIDAVLGYNCGKKGM